MAATPDDRALMTARATPFALWSARLGAFGAMLLVMSGVGHRYGLIETVPFLAVLAVVGTLGIAGLACATLALFGVWRRGDAGVGLALRGALWSLVVLAPFVFSGWRFFAYPTLSDIATDPLDPPRLTFSASRAGYDEAVVAAMADAYPEITGRRYAVPTELVMETVLDLVAARGWQIGATDGIAGLDAQTTIGVTAFSYILRFPADVAIRISDETDTTYVDMRSASRFGRHDLGDNAARIRRFLADLDAAVASAVAASR